MKVIDGFDLIGTFSYTQQPIVLIQNKNLSQSQLNNLPWILIVFGIQQQDPILQERSLIFIKKVSQNEWLLDNFNLIVVPQALIS